jgi:hypothetical protein
MATMEGEMRRRADAVELKAAEEGPAGSFKIVTFEPRRLGDRERISRQICLMALALISRYGC